MEDLLHPQFLKDAAGKDTSVLLPVEEYNWILKVLEAWEEAEEIRAYDKAKAEDDGGRISLKEYLETRKMQQPHGSV